jgi:uncharacterized protein YgbK (DUF1537 family)
MSHDRPLIALISATPLAIPPAEAAVSEAFGEVDIWNILDDRLMVDAETSGGLNPALVSRMESLIDVAVGHGADGVLLTCSMYGSVAAQHRGAVPVLAPDDAVFDDAIQSGGRHILVVASFEEALRDSVHRLREAADASGRSIRVSGVTATAAKASASAGDLAALVHDLAAAVGSSAADADAIVLAQYSLAPARKQLEQRLGRPVFAGPVSAAATLHRDIARPETSPTLGVIADDYTGAIDVADALRAAGLRTLLLLGLEDPPSRVPECDAIVVALKTRSVPAPEAVDSSLKAAAYLLHHGADQIYFKYCSTFDSTPAGNIGPVLDALSDRLEAGVVLTTPSSPRHGRTVNDGRLYVDGVLLEESHMARHPLNPMTDYLVPRLLAAQSRLPVHAIALPIVRAGVDAVRAELEGFPPDEHALVVADAVTDDDLATLAKAQSASALIAGAAGLAFAVGMQRTSRYTGAPGGETPDGGAWEHAAVFAGSCSASTLRQVARFREQGFPTFQLVAAPGMTVDRMTGDALRWHASLPERSTPLFFSSVDAEELERIHDEFGAARVSEIFEESMARIAAGLRDRGVDRFVVAGGETSGAVARGLGVAGGIVGERVDEGVAWLYAADPRPLALLLKSGNFGDPDLFVRATDPGRAWGAR